MITSGPTAQPIDALGGTTYLVTATSNITGATFYWYKDGDLVQVGTANFYYVTVPAGEQVDVQVFDDANTRPARTFPGHVLLGIDEVPGAESYQWDRYVGSAWVTQRSQVDAGESWFEFLTPFLEDDTEHVFRCAALSAADNAGAAREFRFTMVRLPDAATVEGAFDAGTGLTVGSPA